MNSFYATQKIFIDAFEQKASDGIMCLYFAKDDYSQYVINLGAFSEVSDENTREAIRHLLNNDMFNDRNPSLPFTLVISNFIDDAVSISRLIEPTGSLVIDSDEVSENTTEFKKFLTAGIERKRK